jgi:hypothetical protein
MARRGRQRWAIVSPWRYDGAGYHALRLEILRRCAIQHDALRGRLATIQPRGFQAITKQTHVSDYTQGQNCGARDPKPITNNQFHTKQLDGHYAYAGAAVFSQSPSRDPASL